MDSESVVSDSDASELDSSELDALGVDMRRFRLREGAASRRVFCVACEAVASPRTSTLHTSYKTACKPRTATHEIKSPSRTTVSSELSSNSKPSMERYSEVGVMLEKAGRDVQRRDLKAAIVDVEWRGNHTRTSGSGGFADILTRMDMD